MDGPGTGDYTVDTLLSQLQAPKLHAPSITEQPSAAQRCFSTFELTETILGTLWPEDLRAARRVCKDWHDVVARSQHLEKTWRIKPLRIMLLFFSSVSEQGEVARKTSKNSPDPKWANSVRELPILDGVMWDVVLDSYFVHTSDLSTMCQQVLTKYHAFVLFFEISRQESLERARSWCRSNFSVVKRPVLALVGRTTMNRSDSQVSILDVKDLARALDCDFQSFGQVSEAKMLGRWVSKYLDSKNPLWDGWRASLGGRYPL